jgi:hypothetical protein
MASKHREQWVMEAVGCPFCGARRGELCKLNPKSLPAARGRIVLHSERRAAWREWKAKGQTTGSTAGD